MRLLVVVVFAAVATRVPAFTVETPADATVVQRGTVVVVAYGTNYFSVTRLPTEAKQFEFLAALPADYAQGATAPLDAGQPVQTDQVPKVLEAYYRDTALDFDSIRIRQLQVKERGFAAWCTNLTIFGCSYRELRAGTWVEFEVNGRNAQGGMTGFQRRIFMIRRRPMTAAPLPPELPASGLAQ